jgi:hypothetical protein
MTRSAWFAVVLALAVVGCSSHNTTLRRESNEQQIIYRVSEEQAFSTVVDAFAEILPKQSLYDITGPRRGYQSTWRFGLDTYSQRVLIIPAVGTDTSGQEVQGYYFEVSGSGSSGSGYRRNIALFERIRDALEATGTATVVTNVREGRYDTDGVAYRAHGKDASEASFRSRPSAPPTGAAERLRELKALHDQGLISNDEYETKRRQILDRM